MWACISVVSAKDATPFILSGSAAEDQSAAGENFDVLESIYVILKGNIYNFYEYNSKKAPK